MNPWDDNSSLEAIRQSAIERRRIAERPSPGLGVLGDIAQVGLGIAGTALGGPVAGGLAGAVGGLLKPKDDNKPKPKPESEPESEPEEDTFDTAFDGIEWDKLW